MPAYDYVCTKCGEEVELVHRMGMKKRKCPECGQNGLERSWMKVAAYHNRFSPAHPRLNRGKGNKGQATDELREKAKKELKKKIKQKGAGDDSNSGE